MSGLRSIIIFDTKNKKKLEKIMNIDNDIKTKLKQNLAKIITALQKNGMKVTKIALAMNYTSTRQLYNTLDGKCMLSIKAIIYLIKNLNVNPSYLLLGKGNMFLPDETELDTLQKENQELNKKCNEYCEAITVLSDKINKLEKKNDDLIEISSSAIKYYKGLKNE
jgi:hypothetical protein